MNIIDNNFCEKFRDVFYNIEEEAIVTARNNITQDIFMKLMRNEEGADVNLAISNVVKNCNSIIVSKRYSTYKNFASEKDKIVRWIFVNCFRHSPDKLAAMIEKTQRVVLYPKWKKICTITIPMYIYKILSHEYVEHIYTFFKLCFVQIVTICSSLFFLIMFEKFIDRYGDIIVNIVSANIIQKFLAIANIVALPLLSLIFGCVILTAILALFSSSRFDNMIKIPLRKLLEFLNQLNFDLLIRKLVDIYLHLIPLASFILDNTSLNYFRGMINRICTNSKNKMAAIYTNRCYEIWKSSQPNQHLQIQPQVQYG